MADLVVTAANVVAGDDARIKYGKLGATVTAGQAVYLDETDNRFKLADADSATAAVRNAYGIALNGGSSGQTVGVIRSGSLNPGAAVVRGTVYVLSGTPGGICPAADLSAGEYVTVLGIATANNSLDVRVHHAPAAVV